LQLAAPHAIALGAGGGTVGAGFVLASGAALGVLPDEPGAPEVVPGSVGLVGSEEDPIPVSVEPPQAAAAATPRSEEPSTRTSVLTVFMGGANR
jgi:hypothetical protein